MRTSLWISSCVLILSGCVSQQYDIEITPQGDQFERRLTIWQKTGDSVQASAEQELTRLAEAFQQPVPPPVENKHAFRQLFSEHTPDDVGGYGTYARYESPCGSVYGYMERFRGSDDLVTEIDARRKAAGEVVDLLVRWLETELAQDPLWPNLRKFLQTKFLHDLENLSCLAYVHGIGVADEESRAKDLLARLADYALKHAYLTAAELPLLNRAIDDLNKREDPRSWNALLHRVLPRWLELEAGVWHPDSLAILADPKRAGERLDEFLSQTPEYREQVRIAAERDPDLTVSPRDIIAQPLSRALWPPGFLQGSDHVMLKIAVGNSPFETNGEWDSEKGMVTWDLRIEQRLHEHSPWIPRLCYALWAEPDQHYQSEHFGKLVLREHDLLDYCIWYQGLTSAESGEWNKFVSDLKPDASLAEKLIKFRFSGERAPSSSEDVDDQSIAAPGVKLILKGLQD